MNCRRDAAVSQICFKEDTRISHLAGNFAPDNFFFFLNNSFIKDELIEHRTRNAGSKFIMAIFYFVLFRYMFRRWVGNV